MNSRIMVVLGVCALLIAFLQLVGGAIDLASGVWHVLVRQHEFLVETDFWLSGAMQSALGIAWAYVGVKLVRGTPVGWGRLVALLAVSTLMSTLEAAYKLHGGGLDMTQLLSIGIGIVLAVILATPTARDALNAAPAPSPSA